MGLTLDAKEGHSTPHNASVPSTHELDVEAAHASHADFAWRSLYRLGVYESDLPDMLQEVFVVVYRRRRDFDGSSLLRSWIYGICVGIARNYRRKMARRRERSFPEPPERALDGGVETSVTIRDAQRLLDELDPEKRAVLVMFEIEGMTCREIAEVIGAPLGTIHSRLAASRRQLEVALTKWREEQA